jgi:hypothetical protein
MTFSFAHDLARGAETRLLLPANLLFFDATLNDALRSKSGRAKKMSRTRHLFHSSRRARSLAAFKP